MLFVHARPVNATGLTRHLRHAVRRTTNVSGVLQMSAKHKDVLQSPEQIEVDAVCSVVMGEEENERGGKRPP